MGILMGMVTTIKTVPRTASKSLPHIKTLKSSHYSSTHLLQSVHPLETELDAVLALAPLRSPHSTAIPCRLVQLSSQPRNPSLLPRHLASPHFLIGVLLRLPSAVQAALFPHTPQLTLPPETWTTSRRSIVVLVPPINGEGPYRPKGVPTRVITTPTKGMNPSSMPMP